MSEDRRVCLTYLVFSIASKQIMKMPKGKRFCLAYLVAYTANKQAVKVPYGRKVRLTYSIIYTNESYHKVSEARKVYLIYLIFCIANS